MKCDHCADHGCNYCRPENKFMVTSLVSLPRSLSAENGAKALLIGEFHEICTISCPECDGDDEIVYDCSTCKGQGYINQRVPVEWDTIKRIYDKIVVHFSAIRNISLLKH